jgi:hypothetical protein
LTEDWTLNSLAQKLKEVGAELGFLSQRRWSDNPSYNHNLGWWDVTLLSRRTKFKSARRYAQGSGPTASEAFEAAIKEFVHPTHRVKRSELPEISLEELDL